MGGGHFVMGMHEQEEKVECGHKSASAPHYSALPTLLVGSLTPALPAAPPLIRQEIWNRQSLLFAPHQRPSS